MPEDLIDPGIIQVFLQGFWEERTRRKTGDSEVDWRQEVHGRTLDYTIVSERSG